MAEQQTFTEDEIKEAAKWLTWVHKHAKWEDKDKPGAVSSEFGQEIGRFFNWCHKHVKTMQDHVFEIKKVIPAPESEETDKPKKVKKPNG